MALRLYENVFFSGDFGQKSVPEPSLHGRIPSAWLTVKSLHVMAREDMGSVFEGVRGSPPFPTDLLLLLLLVLFLLLVLLLLLLLLFSET